MDSVDFCSRPCPSGTLGNMTIFCNDGSVRASASDYAYVPENASEAAHVLGRCGTNCPAGSADTRGETNTKRMERDCKVP